MLLFKTRNTTWIIFYRLNMSLCGMALFYGQLVPVFCMIAYMSAYGGAIVVVYLGLEVVCVLVVEPDVGIVGVGEGVAGHPVPLVPPAPCQDPRHPGCRSQVQLQPLVL